MTSMRGAAVVAATVLGVTATAAFLYPGYHNGDTWWQYWQAQTGQYSSWHPVLLAWVWARLDAVLPGTGGVFLLNTLGFWLGWSLIAEAFTRTRLGFIGFVAVPALAFPVFSLLGQVAKDTSHGAATLLAFAFVVQADRRRSAPAIVASVVCMGWAIAMRHNGIAAALPLAVVAMGCLARDHLPRDGFGWARAPWSAAVAGLLLVLGLFVLSAGVTRLILPAGREPVRLEQQILAHDLIGISVRVGKNRLPPVFRTGEPPFTLDELAAIYDPHSASLLFWGPEGPRRLLAPDLDMHWVQPIDDAAVDRLGAAWLEAVLDEPGAYLSHRAALFAAQLGLVPNTPLSVVQVRPPQAAYFRYPGPTVFQLPHHKALVASVRALRKSVLLDPWPYVLVLMVGPLVALWMASRFLPGILLLAASAGAHVALLFVVGVHSAGRYVWWPMVAAVALLAILMVEQAERRLAPREARAPESTG